MDVLAIVGLVLEAIPLVRRGWRWLLERGIEVRIEDKVVYDSGRLLLADKPVFVVHVGVQPHIYVLFSMTLTNHHTDRPEKISGGYVALKRPCFWLWRKTIATARLKNGIQFLSSQRDVYWQNIELAAQSFPRTFVLIGEEPSAFPIADFPRKSELVLVLEMVGPVRRIKRVLQPIKHDPRVLQAADRGMP